MTQTSDVNVRQLTPLISPDDLERELPISPAAAETVLRGRQAIRAVLKQGQRRGELSAGRDIEIDIDLLLGAVYFRLLVRRVGVSASLATKIVAAWLPREAAP